MLSSIFDISVVKSALGALMEEEDTRTKCFVRVAAPENICLQCSWLVENAAFRKRLFCGSNKTKTCQYLELLLGDESQAAEEKSAIVCRNCSNETKRNAVYKKIFNLRENFSKTKEELEANMEGSICVKQIRYFSERSQQCRTKASSKEKGR